MPIGANTDNLKGIDMRIRSELWVKEWIPKVKGVSTADATADALNRPHEDYPQRVEATAREIERLSKIKLSASVPNSLLVEIHWPGRLNQRV